MQSHGTSLPFVAWRTLPAEGWRTVTVDVVEDNTFKRPGLEPFNQLILWNLQQDGKYHVRDWCSRPSEAWEIRKRTYPLILPRKRVVVCYKVWKRTTTSYDPERQDKEDYPQFIRGERIFQ